jgi:hypothetical protein
MSAPVLHIKEPLSLLDEDGGFFMADVPADIFKIIFRGWFINLHGKIFTAQRFARAAGALQLLFHRIPLINYHFIIKSSSPAGTPVCIRTISIFPLEPQIR